MERFHHQYFNKNIDLTSEKKIDQAVLQIIERNSGSINLKREKHDTVLLTQV